MAPAKASFSHPAGLDVMVCSQQKKEICFVADQGNHVIRFIDGVKSINCSKLVGTLVDQKEICFVADQGDHVIRFINGVKSINCPKLVGTLKLHPVPEKWRPDGLAVINGTTLAITAGKNLVIV